MPNTKCACLKSLMVHHDGYELYLSWWCCCCCCWGDRMPLCVCWGPLFTFWPPLHCIDYHVFDTAWIELKFSASWRYFTGLPATNFRIPGNAGKKIWELTTGVQSGTAPNKKSRFWCQHPFSFSVFQQAILYIGWNFTGWCLLIWLMIFSREKDP